MPSSELAKGSRLRYQAAQMTHCGPLLTDPAYLELKDRLSGLGVLIGAMAFCLGLSFWAKDVPRPERDPRGARIGVRGISGWPHAVDAIGTLEAARNSSRPRELREIVLEGVKSDGTIDVVTGPGSLDYVFHNGLRDPQPKKADGAHAAETRPTCPRQVVRVRSDGIDPQSEMKDNRCPLGAAEPLPNPVCGPRELWVHAIAIGASIRQLAHMQYYRSKAGPAWKLSLSGGKFEMIMSHDCKRELGPREAMPLSRQ
jgi:hypothetical protein